MSETQVRPSFIHAAVLLYLDDSSDDDDVMPSMNKSRVTQIDDSSNGQIRKPLNCFFFQIFFVF
jgi:hypothetical protein